MKKNHTVESAIALIPPGAMVVVAPNGSACQCDLPSPPDCVFSAKNLRDSGQKVTMAAPKDIVLNNHLHGQKRLIPAQQSFTHEGV